VTTKTILTQALHPWPFGEIIEITPGADQSPAPCITSVGSFYSTTTDNFQLTANNGIVIKNNYSRQTFFFLNQQILFSTS